MIRRLISMWMLGIAVCVVTPSLSTLPAQEKDSQQVKAKKKDKSKSKKEKAPFKGERPSVDVAILLDTSSSMNGLITQAKSQLWNIVQEFAEAKQQGKTPFLRVSVFEYGNSKLPAREGYIRRVVHLTDDLDKVSEALFSLSTRGGDEYCGMVINEALDRLDWSDEPNSYKAIFIAGNEPFTQGEVDYHDACSKAIQKGIVVNTIHCGNYAQGVSGKWQDGAKLAEGEFLNIDQDRHIVHIPCPQDKILIELNVELNKTYLWYGKEAVRGNYATNQAAQDSNASSLGGLGSRVQTKLGSLYQNVGRDLVDSYEADAKILEKTPVAELPESMQQMDAASREKYVQTMVARRNEIKRQMAQVTKDRSEFIAKEMAKQDAAPAEPTFGEVISSTVREQLSESGFEVQAK